MTDLFDRASQRESEILSDSLAEQARRAGLTGKTILDSAHACQDCGEPIPEARRAAYPGVQLCVSCKTFEEEKARGAI